MVSNGTKWGFPKGSCKKEETEEQGAIREIYEETGYIVENIEKYRKKKLVLISFYIIELENAFVSSPVDGEEVKDMQWFTESEIRKMHKNNLLVCNVKKFFKLPDTKTTKQIQIDMSLPKPVIWNLFIHYAKNIKDSYIYDFNISEKKYNCIMSIIDSDTNDIKTFSSYGYNKKDARHNAIEKAILSKNYI